jgi:16S rRNA (cytosine967-C5)-methyltransferase
MRPRELLNACAELLREVLTFSQPTDTVVAAYFRTHRSLGVRERHTLAETVYAVLRRRLLYQHLAQSGSGVMERRLSALGWAGETDYLKAALDEGEWLWWTKARAVDVKSLVPKLRHNLPDWIAQPLQEQLGEDSFRALAASLNVAAALDLRVNTLKSKREAVQQALAQAGVVTEPTPFSPWGLRVQGKPSLQRLDVFTRGEFEVQDEGSQLLALLTGASRGQMVVDFCAGAGGKTLALGAMMRNTGRLYAFDVSGHRLDALKPRLARSGLSNVYPVQIAHERDDRIKRLAGKIDTVLIDAPCSGLGTLRRNPDLKWRQSPATLQELALKQLTILTSAARLVKAGGRLVYATCSLLQTENEAVCDAFTQSASDFEPVPALDVLTEAKVAQAEKLITGGFMRLWPHLHATDGFFAAVWRRK